MRALLLLVLAACPNRPADLEPHDLALPSARLSVPMRRADRHVFLDERGAIHIGAMPASVAEVEAYIRARYPTLIALDGFSDGTPMQLDDVHCSRRKIDFADGQYVRSPDELRAWATGMRGRQMVGAPIAGSSEPPTMPVVLHAAATADARRFVDVVAATGAAIAVEGGGVLPINFADSVPATIVPHAIAVRLLPAHLAVERVGRFDSIGLTAGLVGNALEQSRRECGLHPETRVDVIVEHGVTVQQLVDAIELLERANEHMIGIAKS